MRRTLTLLLLTASLASASAQSPPTRFSAQQPNPQTVPLPDSIRTLLEQDQTFGVATHMAAASPPLTRLPTAWTLCYRITLGPPGELDFLIQGSPPLTGANVVPFWVYRILEGTPRLVLFTGGLNLQIKRRKSNGLPVIATATVTTQQTSTETYRFDGTKYALSR